MFHQMDKVKAAFEASEVSYNETFTVGTGLILPALAEGFVVVFEGSSDSLDGKGLYMESVSAIIPSFSDTNTYCIANEYCDIYVIYFTSRAGLQVFTGEEFRELCAAKYYPR